MTVHAIIKQAEERLAFLEEKSDRLDADYGRFQTYCHDNGKVVDGFLIDERLRKRGDELLKKRDIFHKEARFLRNMIYEYKKIY